MLSDLNGRFARRAVAAKSTKVGRTKPLARQRRLLLVF
jgi:hypothetical protein